MRQVFFYMAFFLIYLSSGAQTSPKYALVIHGGAGVMSEKSWMLSKKQSSFLKILPCLMQEKEQYLPTKEPSSLMLR